jgi:hypothetical protein
MPAIWSGGQRRHGRHRSLPLGPWAATSSSATTAARSASRIIPAATGIARSAGARAAWLADRQADLLPVPYFHVVFTMPAPIAEIALQNKAVVYAILFTAAAETLRIIAADPKHLGAEIGLVAVLHTWGQNLHHHPHVHCVVPGGGPSADRTRWVGCRPGFFLPVKVLSRLYRRLSARLQAAFDAGQLGFGALAAWPASAFAACCGRCGPFPGSSMPATVRRTRTVLDIARYTHRVAIASHAIRSPTAASLPVEGLSPPRQPR